MSEQEKPQINKKKHQDHRNDHLKWIDFYFQIHKLSEKLVIVIRYQS